MKMNKIKKYYSILDVLEHGGMNEKNIAKRVNITEKAIKKTLEEMIYYGLIEKVRMRRHNYYFYITERGREFLENAKKHEFILKSIRI